MSATEEKVVWRGAEALRALLVPIESLEAWPDNPRRGDVEAIRRSFHRFGQVKPVVARGSRIVAGHHMVLAGLEEGWTHIAALDGEFPDEDEARAYLLADNRTAELGVVDDHALAAQLAAVSSFEGIGYSDADRAELAARLAALSADDGPVPDPPANPRSRVGEVYELGPHRLACGDCRDAGLLERLLAGATVDLVWTDPPYGVAYQVDLSPEQARRLHRRTDGLEVSNDALGEDDLRALVSDALGAARPHLRAGACFYVCSPAGNSLAIPLALADAGFPIRQHLVWVKDRFAFGRSDYHYRHEVLLYGWVDGAAHLFVGGRRQDSVWEFPRPARSEAHPTMKPVPLIERAVLNSTVEGAAVLDPFAGSGSTLVACEGTGRVCYSVELDPAYADVIRSRYADAAGRPDLAP